MDYAVSKEIAALLNGGFDIQVVESTVSTNTALKEWAASGAPDGTVLIAHSQQGGRGRMGRSFCSKRGGLYLSVLLKPSISPSAACSLTPIAALAVADSVEAVLGKELSIKWVNDLFYGGKKVCGILTEAAPSTNGLGVEYVIIGIGLNVYEPPGGFGNELNEIATALLPTATEKSGVINRLAAEIIRRVYSYTATPESELFYNAYKKRLFVLGKEVTIYQGNTTFKARVKGLNRDYTLSVINESGEEKTLLSGEVSIRRESYE